MATKKRKRKTLTAPSSHRRRSEDDHADEGTDWTSLPPDIVRIILSKLRQTDILDGGAGLAFPAWRRLALEEPLLWLRIDLRGSDKKDRKEKYFWLWTKPPHAGWKSMALAAVDGSAGRCESFAGHVDADVLVHLANSAPLLKSLNVTGWPYVSDGKLITEIIRKFPLLERVVLRGGEFQQELLLALLDHCPRLEQLDASLSRPMFRVWAEPIATRIRVGRSTIKHFRMPDIILF